MIDVAEVEDGVFLCASMLGPRAHLGRHRAARRERGSSLVRWLRFARAALRSWRPHAAPSVMVRLKGRPLPAGALAITVTANALDDVTGRLFGQPDLAVGSFRST